MRNMCKIAEISVPGDLESPSLVGGHLSNPWKGQLFSAQKGHQQNCQVQNLTCSGFPYTPEN